MRQAVNGADLTEQEHPHPRAPQQRKQGPSTGTQAGASNYVYDPNRGRRTKPYTAQEMQRLSASHRARLKRNRELAKASKERKKQHMQELQQTTTELEVNVDQLKADLTAKQQALQAARAKTEAMLTSCGCSSCTRLQQKLLEFKSS